MGDSEYLAAFNMLIMPIAYEVMLDSISSFSLSQLFIDLKLIIFALIFVQAIPTTIPAKIVGTLRIFPLIFSPDPPLFPV